MNRAVPPPAEVSTPNYHRIQEGHRGYGRIVVGVDGSEGSKEALRWAARQGELTGASLEVVMTWELPVTPYGVWTDYDASGEARQELEATVHEALGNVNQSGIGLEVTEGRPASALLKAAENADLLVVGCRGHGAFAGLLLGSVSQYCATHASCPVVVVPRTQ
jgi:nucleotide-binding universal stress UspA family protein